VWEEVAVLEGPPDRTRSGIPRETFPSLASSATQLHHAVLQAHISLPVAGSTSYLGLLHWEGRQAEGGERFSDPRLERRKTELKDDQWEQGWTIREWSHAFPRFGRSPVLCDLDSWGGISLLHEEVVPFELLLAIFHGVDLVDSEAGRGRGQRRRRSQEGEAPGAEVCWISSESDVQELQEGVHSLDQWLRSVSGGFNARLAVIDDHSTGEVRTGRGVRGRPVG
jgi:hypothetical protein